MKNDMQKKKEPGKMTSGEFRSYRHSYGLSQKEWAGAGGISPALVKMIETGMQECSIKTSEKVWNFIGSGGVSYRNSRMNGLEEHILYDIFLEHMDKMGEKEAAIYATKCVRPLLMGISKASECSSPDAQKKYFDFIEMFLSVMNIASSECVGTTENPASIENIRSFDAGTIIYEEKQSGKDIESKSVFRKLLDKVKPDDAIIFDEASRMSRNADERYRLYMKLLEKNISLVFLKEHHIDTDEYKRRTQNHIARVSSSNEKMDSLINGILGLVADFERENLKDNIRLAFQQAEHEREFLIKRVKERKSRSDRFQGKPEGSRNVKSDKAGHIKKVIMKQSKNFDGKFSDDKIMREYLVGVARNTYYKYKKELAAQTKK